MMSVLRVALLGLVLLSRTTVAFLSAGSGMSTHVNITGTALLQEVTKACRTVIEEAGHEFKPTVGWEIKPSHNVHKHALSDIHI